MILYSTPTSKTLAHHNKAYSQFLKWMTYIPQEIRSLKVLVSGSYAMNCLFSPHSHWSDHDYYFLDQPSLDQAVSYMSSAKDVLLVCETDNAYTYTYKNSVSFQFVKLIYDNPYKVISSFDFTACSVAFDFKDNIYFTPEALLSWKNFTLDFVNFQEWSSSENKSQKTANLFTRIFKYKQRYGFSLSHKAKTLYSQHLRDNRDLLNLKIVSRNSSGHIDVLQPALEGDFKNASYLDILNDL